MAAVALALEDEPFPSPAPVTRYRALASAPDHRSDG
jgi:hypothetical protein